MMTSTEIKKPVLPCASEVCHIGKILIMEACPMIQAGIGNLLAQPCFNVGDFLQAPMAGDVQTMMYQHRADLVMMELSGEGESILDGLRVISQFLATWSTPLIVCTALADACLMKQLAAMGVNGIYLKQDPLSALTECVMRVMDFEYCHSPQAATLIGGWKNHAHQLTYREMDVLGCLFTGKSVTNTARTLHRDIRTISTHKRNAMLKLGFDSDCELYSWWALLSRHGTMA